MSNRDKRKAGELTKSETVYHYTIKQMAENTHELDKAIRAEYEKSMKDLLNMATSEAVKCMAASFVVVLAEEQKLPSTKIQHILRSVDRNVFKVMAQDNDFTVEDLVKMAKNYGVDVTEV